MVGVVESRGGVVGVKWVVESRAGEVKGVGGISRGQRVVGLRR